MALALNGIADVGAHNQHFVTGRLDVDQRSCRPGCPYSEHLVARGDDGGLVPTGRHAAAEQAREEQARRRTLSIRAQRQLRRLLDRIG